MYPLSKSQTRSSSRGRAPPGGKVFSTGRGGAGNLIGVARDEDMAEFNGEEDASVVRAVKEERSRSRERMGRTEVGTTGRGGRGNIRSASRGRDLELGRVPTVLEEQERAANEDEELRYQEVLRKREREGPDHYVSSGRGASPSLSAPLSPSSSGSKLTLVPLQAARATSSARSGVLPLNLDDPSPATPALAARRTLPSFPCLYHLSRRTFRSTVVINTSRRCSTRPGSPRPLSLEPVRVRGALALLREAEPVRKRRAKASVQSMALPSERWRRDELIAAVASVGQAGSRSGRARATTTTRESNARPPGSLSTTAKLALRATRCPPSSTRSRTSSRPTATKRVRRRSSSSSSPLGSRSPYLALASTARRRPRRRQPRPSPWLAPQPRQRRPAARRRAPRPQPHGNRSRCVPSLPLTSLSSHRGQADLALARSQVEPAT